MIQKESIIFEIESRVAVHSMHQPLLHGFFRLFFEQPVYSSSRGEQMMYMGTFTSFEDELPAVMEIDDDSPLMCGEAMSDNEEEVEEVKRKILLLKFLFPL